jgi:hypothetical protein
MIVFDKLLEGGEGQYKLDTPSTKCKRSWNDEGRESSEEVCVKGGEQLFHFFYCHKSQRPDQLTIRMPALPSGGKIQAAIAVVRHASQ